MKITEEEHDYQRPDGLKALTKRAARKPVIKTNNNNWI